MVQTKAFLLVAAPFFALLFCTLAPTQVPPAAAAAEDKRPCTASFYSDTYHGHPTASQERYHKDALTAATNHHPFGTRLKVTNLRNKRTVIVRVNDRMGTGKPCRIDVSRRAAQQLGFLGAGITKVKLEVVGGGKER